MSEKRFARVQNGAVQEVVVVPEGMTLDRMFHEDLLPQFVECTGVKVDGEPVRARMAWSADRGEFLPEPPAPEPEPGALLEASDRRSARKLEDLADALLAKGLIGPGDLPGPTRDWLAQRKFLRRS